MIFFLRNFLPFTYFQTSRLNKWKYVAYHLLLEWLPAILLTLYYNRFDFRSLFTLFLSYLAFICLYEVGYLANDFFSESFEDDPRGRKKEIPAGSTIIWLLIFVRIAVFIGLTFLLKAQMNIFWWAFFAAMVITFIFHNIRSNDHRLSSFFSLSVFRFLGPLILCLPSEILIMMFAVIMLNYSFFRTIVYGDNKNLIFISSRETSKFKFTYYLNCLPLGVVLSLSFNSFIPVIFCLYYMFMWILYGFLSR